MSGRGVARRQPAAGAVPVGSDGAGALAVTCGFGDAGGAEDADGAGALVVGAGAGLDFVGWGLAVWVGFGFLVFFGFLLGDGDSESESSFDGCALSVSGVFVVDLVGCGADELTVVAGAAGSPLPCASSAPPATSPAMVAPPSQAASARPEMTPPSALTAFPSVGA